MFFRMGLALYVAGLACFFSGAAGANETIARMFWNRLHVYEADAIRDYTSNNVSDDVLILSEQLWDLSQQAVVEPEYETCRIAARTLSMMVAGSYWSAKSNEVAMDWHLYSGDYVKSRSHCLRALKVEEEGEHRLPLWFGR